MSKLISIVIALLLVGSDVGLSQSSLKKSKKRRPPIAVLTGGESGGQPKYASPLYKYTRQLPVVDSVEVSKVQLGPSPTFLGTQVLKTVTIHGPEAEAFARTWRNLNSGPGAGCFSPAYMVKFFLEKELLLESTICFHCRNLTLPVEGRSEINSFDSEGETGQNLLKAIQRALADHK